MIRVLLAILLCLVPTWAWADITVVGVISPAHSASTITAVAMRGTTELDSDECTNAESASGIWTASGTLDLSAAGAGYVTVYFIDATGEHVTTPIEFEIDASGDEVDRLPYIDVATSSRLAPTTAGRTLDVTATGAAGIDWGNIENPTSGVTLENTSVKGAEDQFEQINELWSDIQSLTGTPSVSLLADLEARTLPSAQYATAANLTTVGGNVTAILEDTGTTLPGTLSTIGSNVTSILEDTGTTLPGTLSTIDGNVDAILEDTGTTLPGTLAGLATQASVNTIDGIVDNIYTAFELDGSVYRLTTNALEQGGAVSLDPEDIDAIASAAAEAVGEGIGEEVWTYSGDRVLTAGTNIVLDKGTGITGFNDISVSDIFGATAASHNTAGTIGGLLNTTGGNTGTIVSNVTSIGNNVADILVDTGAMTTSGVAIATGGITTASFAAGAITQEVFDDGVELGGGISLEDLQQELANLNLDLTPVTNQLDDIESTLGGLTANASPVLQHDIFTHFAFRFSGRNDGNTSAVNTIRLNHSAERPRIGFIVDTLTVAKPAIIQSVEVLDASGTASDGITVADEEDTTNCGVRDWLIMTKITNVTTSGTYTIRLTFTAADSAVYVVSGNVVVP